MAVELVKTVIEVGFKIKAVLEKYKGNHKECGKICDFVDTLSADLKSLGAPIMKNHGVRTAMERLKDALERTEMDVKRCISSNAALKAFKADDIARDLDGLRQDISEKIVTVVLLTSVSTNSQVDRINHRMDQISISLAAIHALLVPLYRKFDQLAQHLSISDSTDDAKKKGLISYSWSDLEAAISSNKYIIGGGSSSSVYQGKLDNKPVAIKKFRRSNASAKAGFLCERNLVSKLQHGNIVKLLGYCYENNDRFVQEGNDIQFDENHHLAFVSRYMSNQSLIRVIEGNKHVDWSTLFRIIQGIAKGLHYLHGQRVVHLDLKPENILLDADMSPKINNFGKAKALEPGSNEINLDEKNLPGTGKYMAPEQSMAHTASNKSDVYSFGVILLETISLMCSTSKKGCDEDWAKRMEESELRDLFDPKKVTGELQLTLATRCMLVGLLCCLPDPAGRPSMQTVIDMLGDSHTDEKKNTDIASSSGSLHGGNGRSHAKGEKIYHVPAAKGEASSSSPSLPDDSESISARDKERGYKVLTQDNLRARQNKDMAMVGEFLSIPLGVAAILLQHCHWSPELVHSRWFDENGEAFRNAVGLPSSPGDVAEPKVVKHSNHTCYICSDGGSADAGRRMISAGCSHYYCDGFWRRHIQAAVDTGSECLSLRCPDSSCPVPVVQELVEMVAAGGAHRAKYERFALRSYVDDSGGAIKWCPATCGRAIELLRGAGDSADVLCDCMHGFCWRCGEEPHCPVSCDTARAWLEKSRSKASPDDNSRYLYHYNLWAANDKALKRALADMDELKNSWIGNMAAQLGIRAADLDFLTKAYGEIAKCRRVIRWVHAYGYFLDPERDGNKYVWFDHLQKQASMSLGRLHVFAEEERVNLCAAEVEAISEMYSAFKTGLMELTGEAREDFDKLERAVKTGFQE